MCVFSSSVKSNSATPWTIACQAPLSMDFPGKNTGMCCHFLLQGNLLIPEIKLSSPVSAALQVDYLWPGPLGSLRDVTLLA